MDNSEQDIRRFLETAAERAPEPTAIPATTVHRARRKRAGVLVSSILGVAILIAGITLGVTALRDEPPHVFPANPDQTPSPEKASRTYHHNLGLAITPPTDWTVKWSEPPQSTALYGATYAFDRGSGFCGKQGLLTTMPSAEAFFWMFEFDGADASPRPQSFKLDEKSFAAYEGSGCVPTYRIDFSDSGRHFIIHVAFGSDASTGLRSEVLQVLDSLEVESNR